MNQTSNKVIYLVVFAIAVLAAMGMATICYCAVKGSAYDPQMGAALLTLTSGLVGSLATILCNPRGQPPNAITETTTTTTTSPDKPNPIIPGGQPAKVEIVNSDSNPAKVQEVT